jgi:hypothetical protein
VKKAEIEVIGSGCKTNPIYLSKIKLRCEVGDVLPPSDSAPSDPVLSVQDAASGWLTPRYAQNLLGETEDAA